MTEDEVASMSTDTTGAGGGGHRRHIHAGSLSGVRGVPVRGGVGGAGGGTSSTRAGPLTLGFP